MALPVPSLDDRSFDDLVREALALIPRHDPAWTDHNPADPGVTLIELFAWLTEMIIFRLDQISDEQMTAFLRLLNGPQWAPAADRTLEDEVGATLIKLRHPYRAVTAADYERLALEASPAVARAVCVPRRDLAALGATERSDDRPDLVSLVIIPCEGHGGSQGALEPDQTLCKAVWSHVEPRRLLGTRHKVVGPVYSPVAVELVVVRNADADRDDTAQAVAEVVREFLHPLRGGPDGTDWRMGRSVYAGDLFGRLERQRQVDAVLDIRLTSVGTANRPAATSILHDGVRPVGLRLPPYALPLVGIAVKDVAVVDDVLPLRVAARIALKDGVLPADGRAAAVSALTQALHPLHGGPGGAAAVAVSAERLIEMLRKLPEVARVPALTLDCPSRPSGPAGDGGDAVIDFPAYTAAELEVAVSLPEEDG